MKAEEARAWTSRLYRRLLPQAPDGYRVYLDLLDRLCPPGGRVVDLGCGEEAYLSFLLERAEVIGVDSRVVSGPYHGYLRADLDSGKLPLDERSVDLAASKFLLEHLERPPAFLRAVWESLRPGGHLVLMTPNVLYYPYAVNYLLSRVLSQRLRMRLVSLVTGRNSEGIFPVRYRCNTPFTLRKALMDCGYEILHLGDYPDYLVSAVCRVAGGAAVLYEVAAGRLGIPWTGGFLVAAARKEG